MPGQPTFRLPDPLVLFAADFGVSREGLLQMLHSLPSSTDVGSTNPSSLEEFCRSANAEEFVLARACAEGNDRAWDVFLTRYREKLYGFARHIAKEDSAARELADGIYAELYGIALRDGKRVSKLASYLGRGSLEGWLRTVLAQAWVNRYRKQRREVSLDEQAEEGAQFAAPETAETSGPSSLLNEATDAALQSLENEERYILAAYYLDERTLAEIARTLAVHESTVSRKLERIGKSARKAILSHLSKAGMSRRQAEEAMACDIRDLPLDVRKALQAHADCHAGRQDLPGELDEKKSSAKSAQDSGSSTF